jgi:hypothetical protein
MFILTEQTPNPATLKFLPGVAVMPSGTANFTSKEATSRSPLAERLFGLPEVSGVFLSGDFITATKTDNSDWSQMKPAVLTAIMEHFTTGQPIITGTSSPRRRKEKTTGSSRRSRNCSKPASAPR